MRGNVVEMITVRLVPVQGIEWAIDQQWSQIYVNMYTLQKKTPSVDWF